MTRRRANSRRVIATTTRHPGGAPRTHRSCPLGERIEKFAAARGMTLTDLAESVGLSRSGLNDIRRGRTPTPRLGTLAAIAETLRVPLDRLIAGIF